MAGPEEQEGASSPGVAVRARPLRAGWQDQRVDPLLPPGGDRARWAHLGAPGRRGRREPQGSSPEFAWSRSLPPLPHLSAGAEQAHLTALDQDMGEELRVPSGGTPAFELKPDG